MKHELEKIWFPPSSPKEVVGGQPQSPLVVGGQPQSPLVVGGQPQSPLVVGMQDPSIPNVVETISLDQHKREMTIEWIMNKMANNDILTEEYLRSLSTLQEFDSDQQTELIKEAQSRMIKQDKKMIQFMNWWSMG